MSKLIKAAGRDYLKAIYLLGQTRPSRRILTNEIAKRLGLRAASVTGMLGRLAEEGLVDYKKRRGVLLTEKGEKVALEMVRRHRLIETFLFEKLGFSWDELHDEAEQLEHAVSGALCRRLDEILEFPAVDPHGAPIPNSALDRPQVATTRLSSLRPGDRAKIMRLSDRNSRLLRQAAAAGLRPGTILEIVQGPAVTLRRQKDSQPRTITESLGKIIYVQTLSSSES